MSHHGRARIRVRVEPDVLAFLVIVRDGRVLSCDGRGRLCDLGSDIDNRRLLRWLRWIAAAGRRERHEGCSSEASCALRELFRGSRLAMHAARLSQ